MGAVATAAAWPNPAVELHGLWGAWIGSRAQVFNRWRQSARLKRSRSAVGLAEPRQSNLR